MPRSKYGGYGFEILYDSVNHGPTEVKSVVPNSQAFTSGLRVDDVLLKINNVNVVNEQYTKIISMVKESIGSNGALKLEVLICIFCFILKQRVN